MKKNKLLISACLFGENIRYDGKNSLLSNDLLKKLHEIFILVPLCPEILGGLAVPRMPCEIEKGDGKKVLAGVARIFDRDSKDQTKSFIKGANKALLTCKEQGIKLALLKSKSPSCGSKKIYDGSFSKNLIDGVGVTVALLISNDIKVYSENEIKDLLKLDNC